jgi:hypothetical protein
MTSPLHFHAFLLTAVAPLRPSALWDPGLAILPPVPGVARVPIFLS